MELLSRWTEPKSDFLCRFSELVQVVQLYKQKVFERWHKNFMRSAIHTFCKRLKSKQYYEIKTVAKHAAKKGLDGFSNSNTMYLTQRKTQNNLQLQWKCISM